MRTKSKPAKPASPLRQRMIDDMIARKHGRESQRGHIAACVRFASWLKRSPDTATADDVCAFQKHLMESGLTICNRNRIMTGLKFLLKVTLRRHDLAAEIYHLKEPVRLPLILAPEEVERIIAHAPSFKAHVMLVVAYGCGLRAGEVVRLRVCDIDREQKIIRIVQSKGRKDRHVMLPAEVHALLREWWCERPVCNDMGIPSDERWLFPGRGEHEHLTTRQLSRLFHQAADAAGIRFSPTILPPYMRRSKSIETLLPILYLKGISTGDFSEALSALLGKDAAGLSASAIGRLKDGWQDDHATWQKRDLSAKRFVYLWADGIHIQARLEDERQCILVIIGATPEGKKELVGFTDGTRESAHDWRALLLDLKRRGLDARPELAIADGALGFWKAAGEVWPKTREQRRWVHKTANVLNKLPKSQQPKAKRALQEIWMGETKGLIEGSGL